jgi:hypothetical protein
MKAIGWWHTKIESEEKRKESGRDENRQLNATQNPAMQWDRRPGWPENVHDEVNGAHVVTVIE